MKSLHYILCALLCIASLSSCQPLDEPLNTDTLTFLNSEECLVLVTDSDEWTVKLFKEHLVYSEAVKTNLPAPWLLPTREDAQVLKTCSYPHEERFITSDGYTFGMPSSSVSKAGAKTKYSVLGLWKRTTTIDVPF